MSKRSAAFLATRILDIAKSGPDGLIVIVNSDGRADLLGRLLSELAPDRTIRVLPAWDCLPYDRASPSVDIMGQRMRTVRDIAQAKGGAILVTTPEAALQRLPLPRPATAPIVIEARQPVDPDALDAALVRFGYRAADRVEEVGQYAIRGEVIDIYPPARHPRRVTILEGVAAAIHRFDPVSQYSAKAAVARLLVGPVSEIVPPEGAALERIVGMEHWLPVHETALGTLFTLLPGMPVLMDPGTAQRTGVLFRQTEEAYAARLAADAAGGSPGLRALSPDRLYLTEAEWQEGLRGRSVSDLPEPGVAPAPKFYLEPKVGKAFRAFVRQCRDAGQRLVLAAGSARTLAAMTTQAEHATGEAAVRVQGWDAVAQAAPGAMLALRVAADAGFVDEAAGIALVAASDLLGSRVRGGSHHAHHHHVHHWHGADGEFAIDDAVIHLDHGMGILRGLETLGPEVEGGAETARFDFAQGTDLLAPVEDLQRVWRYGAAEAVALDRLHGDGWPKRRARIMAQIDETARQLVELATVRSETVAPKLVPPGPAYEAFAEGFPFAMTADQEHAVADVLADLASGRPMDRLVIGDVGFGKTEVALRAAAAAVLAGKQVAVVAPTTVLVRQHVTAFRRRFEALGIEVGHLSRLVEAKEADTVREDLASGRLRLVVGTHALAADAVRFADLGLLIIDEEQRFGAADKAKLRGFGPGVHTLTLTATPIPRTLQTALVGLQDLSTIATAPARRRPIRTLVAPFDAATVRTALMVEKARGGQSFVVVPRVEDLDRFSHELRRLLPDLVVAVAHGSMDEHEADTAMVDFADGQGDVLLATSIIESGLDVPRANTMIVIDADRFGLAQLHQLRGRVGRGSQQGICYLMTDAERTIAEPTRQRLSTLATLDRLGSGMAISVRDLDARGAGELVGEKQAGHLRLIGLGLYQHLLQLAVRQARGEAIESWMPEIHGDNQGGSIPEAYIPAPVVRLNLYARMSRITDVGDLDTLSDELEDRFGPMPEAVHVLLARIRLRCLCRSHGVARVDVGPKAIALTLRPGADVMDLLEHAPARERDAMVVKNDRLIFAHALHAAQDRLLLASRLLGDLH